MKPCNFPKAIKLPVNVRVPMKIDTIIVVTRNVDWSEVPNLEKNSAVATSADAPPPNPLKIATIWGICVISTRNAKVAPIMEPIIIPIAISLKSKPPKDETVAKIAISIPIEAMAFPVLAVLGELNLLIPRMKRTAAKT